MVIRRFHFFLLAVVLVVFLGVNKIMPRIVEIRELPDNLILSENELLSFSGSITCAYRASEDDSGTLDFRLLGIFPIKTVSAKVEPERTVRLGGMPAGISVKSDGVIVTAIVEVDTSVGKVRPQTGVEAGDIITEFNGKRILYTDDILEIMREYGSAEKQAEIKVLRGGKERKVISYPVIEQYTESYKLGFEVKEYAEGIGTVSYIKENGEFGSLGHPINSLDGTLLIPCYGGSVYDCKIVGHNRGMRGNPGELRGVFVNPNCAIGEVNLNTRFGVYGKFDTPPKTQTVEIGGRLSVHPGKAKMITTIGDKSEFYDIEVIKAMPQGMPGEKGMVIRVTDKRLLALTGGIVQGMSGSPILQDGKLVGAVTHVFLSDPTKGYAVYMDWMYL